MISTLRAAFPDLRFEVHELSAKPTRGLPLDDDRHPPGPPRIGPMAGLPINGAGVDVPHMHFFRYDAEGRLTDLWHVWNTLMLARQLGAPAPDLRIATTNEPDLTPTA